MDEPRALRMFRAIGDKLPVLIHTGDYRYDFSGPKRMAHVLDEVPELTAIGAHLGGWSQYEEAVETLAGRRMYVDTCSAVYALRPERAVEIIRAFGVENVLFGTDFPMWTPKEEVERIENLALTQEEKEVHLPSQCRKAFEAAFLRGAIFGSCGEKTIWKKIVPSGENEGKNAVCENGRLRFLPARRTN